MNRRESIKLLAAAAAFSWTPTEVRRAVELATTARLEGRDHQPKFFTPQEWETVRVLVDLILPRDERSGSATDAGVPEFMDFMLVDGTDGARLAMRGGLAWLDAECRRRFAKRFVECADADRRTVLDDIAWPARAGPEVRHGVAFFNRFRDLTASGFWSSRMGVADLEYQGNRFVPEWKGCPEAAQRKLGVSYDEWNRRYGEHE